MDPSVHRSPVRNCISRRYKCTNTRRDSIVRPLEQPNAISNRFSGEQGKSNDHARAKVVLDSDDGIYPQRKHVLDRKVNLDSSVEQNTCGRQSIANELSMTRSRLTKVPMRRKCPDGVIPSSQCKRSRNQKLHADAARRTDEDGPAKNNHEDSLTSHQEASQLNAASSSIRVGTVLLPEKVTNTAVIRESYHRKRHVVATRPGHIMKAVDVLQEGRRPIYINSGEELQDTPENDSTWGVQGEEGATTGLTARKRYRFINRQQGLPDNASNLGARRNTNAMNTDTDDFSTWTCCQRMRCFQNFDITFFRTQRKRLLLAPQQLRKQTLLTMLQSDGKFYFNLNRVCTHFLSKGFGFSKDLQRSVKGTPKAPSPPTAKRIPKMNCSANQRERILSFLQTLADDTADNMPNSYEQHLPFHQKKHVYEVFLETLEAFNDGCIPNRPPSFSYFLTTWKEYLGSVKVRAIQRFTKCTECEMIRSELTTSVGNTRRTEELMLLRRNHIKFVTKERASYLSRMKRAQTAPKEVWSVVIDGADQSEFGLPHFTINTKDTRGESLKVKLIGLLDHGTDRALSLFTLTAQFETGANHLIESLHRWLDRKAEGNPLPKTIFIQMDNCTRENKNRYTLGYIEMLVAIGVVGEVQVSFLPIGHTHSDIDQTFSCTSRRLKANDAITLKDLHDELRKSYTPTPTVSSILNVANISGLFQKEKCLQRTPPFSQYRYFLFQRRGEPAETGSRMLKTTCMVKVNCDDDWQQLFPEEKCGFLKFTPRLASTPKTVLTSPENGRAVTERIESEVGRINDEEKVLDLLQLRDDVYRYVEKKFHWDLKNCFEGKAVIGSTLPHGEEAWTGDMESRPATRISYNLNTFVVVRPDPCTRDCPFWVGQVLALRRNSLGDVTILTLRWYEVEDGMDVFDGKYKPSVYRDGNGRLLPWVGDVGTDTVMFQIERLTEKRRLGRTAARRIQMAMNSYVR